MEEEKEEKQENIQERILYQYIMSSKAYRRKMIFTRILISLIISGGLFSVCAFNLILGIILGVMPLFIGAVFVITGLSREETYMIFNTRLVIKIKNGKRYDIPNDNILLVTYKRAFYEKDLRTATVAIKAYDNHNGKIKTYKFRHAFNCKDGFDYLTSVAENNEKTKPQPVIVKAEKVENDYNYVK